MVDADVAGVMFTANPLTGRRRETVIDAAPGLGEALVSGAVNPDQFTVDAATGEILQRSLGDKRTEIRPARGGGTRLLRRQDGGRQACLTDEQVRSLARVGTRVEEVYGEPQDVEWAIAPDGGIRVVQSRPITTLFPLPEPDNHDGGARAYLCASLLQGLTRPLTPMGLASFTLMSDSSRSAGNGPAAYRSAQIGMRMFVDVTSLLAEQGREARPAEGHESGRCQVCGRAGVSGGRPPLRPHQGIQRDVAEVGAPGLAALWPFWAGPARDGQSRRRAGAGQGSGP